MDITSPAAALKTPSPGQGDITQDDCLNEAAQFIRVRTRRVVADIIAIGKRLTVCHNRVHTFYGHGHWYLWLRENFDWSVDTADRYIHVAELAKSRNLRDLDLPLSSLYLLSAPATPEIARDEILTRAEAGEKLSCATVTEIITKAKNIGVEAVSTPEVSNSADMAEDDKVVLWDHKTGQEYVDENDGGHAQHENGGGHDDHHDAGAIESGSNAGENDDQHASGEDQCAPVADRLMNGNTVEVPDTTPDDIPASDPPRLSAEVWRAATSAADEAVKVEITQTEELETILGRLSEAQKDKLFDRLIGLQIRQAKPVSKSADDMLKSITATFHYMAGQDDPQKIAEAMAVINGKLKNRQLSAKDIKLAAANREHTISPAATAAAKAARENLKRRKH